MTAEDAGLNVEAENKVTVRGGFQGVEAFTLADLRVAARELTARGVPADARVEVTMNPTATRWSIVARWEPVPGVKHPATLGRPVRDAPQA